MRQYHHKPTVRRISVVGTSGSGKTTVARNLAARLEVPHIELDSLFWEPNWAQTPTDLFRERVERALEADAWVVDGNYSRVRDLVWGKADMIVWLDYPLRTVMRQVVWRTLRRAITREELWHGNRERLGTALFSRDSIVLWALTTYRRRRAEYSRLLGRPQSDQVAVVHLRSPRAARDWLAKL